MELTTPSVRMMVRVEVVPVMTLPLEPLNPSVT